MGFHVLPLILCDGVIEPTDQYSAFVTAVSETNSKLLPRKRRRVTDSAMDDPRVQEVREELFVAKKAFFSRPSEGAVKRSV